MLLDLMGRAVEWGLEGERERRTRGGHGDGETKRSSLIYRAEEDPGVKEGRTGGEGEVGAGRGACGLTKKGRK